MSGQASAEQKKLFGGVLVLMPATLFTKMVGLFYKIPLIAIVGVTGMAYFLAAYHVYSLLFVISATGLPAALSLAVSKAMAAGRGRTADRTLRVALLLFLSLGLGGTALLWFGAPFLAKRLAMGEAVAALKAIAPALLLSALVGAAKGYFQGRNQMLPTALSEVIEAGGKLGFGLCFALLAKGRGYDTPTVAAYAIFGITAGLALAALCLAIWLTVTAIRFVPTVQQEALPPRRTLLGSLLRVALPITVSSSVMGLSTLLDTALISNRLQSVGFAASVANAMYSSYGNLAVPLYNLVPSLLTPVTLALMPLLGAALSKGEGEGGKAALTAAWRLTFLVALPAALGLAVFARPILQLIFGGQGEAVALAAPLLSLLALSVLPTALITLTGAALQAAGHAVIPVLAMGVGVCVKFGMEFFLLALPAVHIYGAPVSTLCCNLSVLILQGIALAKVLPFRFFALRDLFRPLLAAIVAVGGGIALYVGLLYCQFPGRLLILPVLLAVLLLFLAFALRLRAVGREELGALPGGERICRALEKIKLLK